MRTYPIAIVVVVALVLGFGLARHAVGIWAGPHDEPSCIGGTALVLGAAQYDGRPSPAFARRLDRAVELYASGCVERIVVSGGRQPRDRFTEGEAGLRYLVRRAVPSDAVAAETTASTTLENLEQSRGLVGEGPVVIVTDDLHAHRTAWLADRLDLNAELAAVPVPEERFAYGLRELVILLVYQLGLIR